MRLFVYGTLLDRARRARLVGRDITGVPARLAGWRRVRLPGTPYPTLRRAFRAGVAGVVIDVDAPALRRLAAYEGGRYRLARIAVSTARGNTAAFAWIADAAGRRDWP
jgi:gamma-glutamylcyclotransferase (GGCT)/AIG2-like uncharacterized protein YtfP